MRRLTSALITLSLLASSAPAFAAGSDALPSEPPCQGTSDRARARCITDALKAWKELERNYFQDERTRVAEWKKEHSDMGIGPAYQTALREFLNQVREEQKQFKKQLQAFRKLFFDEQKEQRMEGDGAKATEVKLEKSTLEQAKEFCGTPDDDGAWRLCMRQQLRKLKTENVDQRSRTSPRLQRIRFQQ